MDLYHFTILFLNPSPRPDNVNNPIKLLKSIEYNSEEYFNNEIIFQFISNDFT